MKNLDLLYLSGVINENQYHEQSPTVAQQNTNTQNNTVNPQEYVEQVANEYLQQEVATKCPLNKVGKSDSANCSWFAKDFHEWAIRNNKGKVEIIFFIWSNEKDRKARGLEHEESAHIVPILNGYIVDYIQEFSGNKPFLISKIGTPKQNQVLPINNLPSNVANYYMKWYDDFIYGNNIAEIEKIMTSYMQQHYPGSGDFKVGPFVPPNPNQTNSNESFIKSKNMKTFYDYLLEQGEQPQQPNTQTNQQQNNNQQPTQQQNNNQQSNNIDQIRKHLHDEMMKDQGMSRNPQQRVTLQNQVYPFIQKNIKEILSDRGANNNGDCTDGNLCPASFSAWLLVQHMDANPERQLWFAQQLESNNFTNHVKYQFIKDRGMVNQKIIELYNANKDQYKDKNGQLLTNPTSDVRDSTKFDDASGNYSSAQQALEAAKNAGNELLYQAVVQTNAKTQPSYTQQS